MKKKKVCKNSQLLHICHSFNNHGYTLIETVVAIVIIALASMVMYSIFFSTSRISKYSDEQIKRNAIIRIIKENVAASVRNDTEIYGTGKKAGTQKLEDLPVKDLSDQEYSEYAFDLEYIGEPEISVLQYKVTLKNKYGSNNTIEFQFEVYKP